MEANPTVCPGIGLIYAWNEIGEGGYILPTVKYGYSLLKATRDVFNLQPVPRRKTVRLRRA